MSLLTHAVGAHRLPRHLHLQLKTQHAEQIGRARCAGCLVGAPREEQFRQRTHTRGRAAVRRRYRPRNKYAARVPLAASVIRLRWNRYATDQVVRCIHQPLQVPLSAEPASRTDSSLIARTTSRPIGGTDAPRNRYAAERTCRVGCYGVPHCPEATRRNGCAVGQSVRSRQALLAGTDAPRNRHATSDAR